MQKIGSVTETADQNGEFTNGNVAQGVPPTILKAEIFNTWQRELVGVVEGASINLDPNNDNQLLAAINKIIVSAISQSIPTGVPLPWPTSSAPSGWLSCDGSLFNKSQYPQLALAYPSGRLPDLRGGFIRGAGSGREVLSSQDATMLRTGIMEYYGQDESRVDGASGIGFVNEDALQETMPVGAKSPVGSLQPTSGTLNDNAIIGRTETSWISEGSRWISMRPQNIAFNYIVRAA